MYLQQKRNRKYVIIIIIIIIIHEMLLLLLLMMIIIIITIIIHELMMIIIIIIIIIHEMIIIIIIKNNANNFTVLWIKTSITIIMTEMAVIYVHWPEKKEHRLQNQVINMVNSCFVDGCTSRGRESNTKGISFHR